MKLFQVRFIAVVRSNNLHISKDHLFATCAETARLTVENWLDRDSNVTTFRILSSKEV